MTAPTTAQPRSDRHTRLVGRFSAALACLLVILTMARPAPGQVLVIHPDSVTTYVPDAKTSVQDVQPLPVQVGVNLDGSGRKGSALGWALAGNPSEPGYRGAASLGGVDLVTGNYAEWQVHLTFPAAVPWVIGTSYNALQENSSTRYDSNGPMGRNRFQISQPELVFYDDPSDAADDMMYLVYGADRYIAFRRVSAISDDFYAVNGATGALEFIDADNDDQYRYVDQRGLQTYFWAGNSHASDWQLWKVVDPAGNTAYVGHATTIASAKAAYNSDGTIATAYDSNGIRYTYTYTTLNSVKRLTKVVAEVEGPISTWTEIGEVEYDFYESNTADKGSIGDLKLVTTTVASHKNSNDIVRRWYYRYYTEATGTEFPYHVKMVVGPEGCRRYDWAPDETIEYVSPEFLTASDSALKPYATVYVEYDSSHRVDALFQNGACGCTGGAGDGEYKITYSTNGSHPGNAGYDEEWKTLAVVEPPSGGAWLSQFFDEQGQGLGTVRSDANPSGSSNDWATDVIRNTKGTVDSIASPANASYTESTKSFSRSWSAGLITVFSRKGTGDLAGFIETVKHQEDTGGTAYLISRLIWDQVNLSVGDATVIRPFVDERWRYEGEEAIHTAAGIKTAYDHTWYDEIDSTDVEFIVLKDVKVTSEAVTTGENGDGNDKTTESYFRKDGSAAFTRAKDGVWSYSKREDGKTTQTVADADISATFQSGDDPNTDWGINESGASGLAISTTMTYDDEGRRLTTTKFEQSAGKTPPQDLTGETCLVVLADQRIVRLSVPRKASSKYYGPVACTVTNQAGQVEASGTIALSSSGESTAPVTWIDETKDNIFDAVTTGTLSGVTTTVFDASGARPTETRSYFDLTFTAGTAGVEGTDYDASYIGYDDNGRRWRTKSADGTISRTVFDELGRATESWIGTNDSSFSGGESAGTDDMIKTSTREYDANGVGNGDLTKTTADPDGNWSTTGDQRVTSFTYDYRGRRTKVDNPQGPDVVTKYDNLGRATAVGAYTTLPGATSPDPTSVTTDRVGLSETFYDEAGRVWKTVVHKIDPDDGSSDDTLTSENWYDDAGRVIKTTGAQTTKTFYDDLGRATNSFVIADDNDAAYADMDDVSGDLVLSETQTYYDDDTGYVLMSVTIQRHHDDYGAGETTGALENELTPDMSVVDVSATEGRLNITAFWYDELGRRTDTGAYGTYDGTDFDRDTISKPTTHLDTDGVIWTSVSYNDNGTTHETTDPRGKVTRTLYDDANRRTAVIRNYVNGTPSGATGDDDLHTRYEYTDGHMVKMWVDIDGDGTEDADDQVTQYTYGVTKGASTGDSTIGHGGLLQKVLYPDDDEAGESEADYRVRYAYNALGEQDWMEDQLGVVTETTRDTGGRVTDVKYTDGTSTGLDTSVKRITTAYTNLGQVDTITTYDATTGGSAVNAVKYVYDDWGNITDIHQDKNGAYSGAGDHYTVSFAYEKGAGNWEAVRLTSMTLPDATVIDYEFTANDEHDNDINRVTEVEHGTTVVAQYQYNGVGTLIRTDLPEPDFYSTLAGTTSGNYDNLDEFGRVTSSIWTKDLTTDRDFYDVDITYDDAGNIKTLEDNIHTWTDWDVKYTMDGLNRVTKAELGDLVSGSIDTANDTDTWTELWTLDHLGNWDTYGLDLNGDQDYSDTDELDDDRVHSLANELETRDTDDDSTVDLTLAHDKRGQMTDDGTYDFVYDLRGRLVEIKTGSDFEAAFEYNALGHRTSAVYDTDDDGLLSDETITYFVYDSRWRIVATYLGGDSDPTEQSVYHAAGLGGSGGSSYIDSVILVDRDTTANGTLDQRRYPLQNWRADVSLTVDDSGVVVGWTKYDVYGLPVAMPQRDFNSDTFANDQDWFDFLNDYNGGSGSWNAHVDVDCSGTVTSQDYFDWVNVFYKTGTTVGRGHLRAFDDEPLIGYAGYVGDLDFARLWHVRNRVLDSELGRWTRRDPPGYIDGPSLYPYVASRPMEGRDPLGLCRRCTGAGLRSSPHAYSGTWSHLKGTHVVFDCLEWCAYVPQVYFLMTQYQNECTRDVPLIVTCVRNGVGCNPMNPNVAGHYSCDFNIIEVCLPLGDDPCLVVAHELVHAIDSCKRGSSCERQEDCGHLACTEARAAALDCCNEYFRNSMTEDDGVKGVTPDGTVTWEECMLLRRAQYARRLQRLIGCDPQVFAYEWQNCARDFDSSVCDSDFTLPDLPDRVIPLPTDP